jgi:hypothetical protein
MEKGGANPGGFAGDALLLRIHSSSAFANGYFHKADGETVSAPYDKDEPPPERFARKMGISKDRYKP